MPYVMAWTGNHIPWETIDVIIYPFHILSLTKLVNGATDLNDNLTECG